MKSSRTNIENTQSQQAAAPSVGGTARDVLPPVFVDNVEVALRPVSTPRDDGERTGAVATRSIESPRGTP